MHLAASFAIPLFEGIKTILGAQLKIFNKENTHQRTIAIRMLENKKPTQKHLQWLQRKFTINDTILSQISTRLQNNCCAILQKPVSSDPSKLKDSMQIFLLEHQIRHDIKIVEHLEMLKPASSKGTNRFSKGIATIKIMPGLYYEDKDACIWAIKREICHIKRNDSFVKPLIITISSLAAAILGTIFLPLSLPVLVLAVAACVYTILKQLKERSADQFAIENCSKEELLGGIRLLKVQQQLALEERSRSLLKKLTISPTGTPWLQYIKIPSIASRIRKIEQHIKKDTLMKFYPDHEKQKVAHLKEEYKKSLAFVKACNDFGIQRKTYDENTMAIVIS